LLASSDPVYEWFITMRLPLLIALAVILGPVARAQDAVHPPPDYTQELGAPADGQFRKSATWEGVEETYLPSLFPSSHAASLLRLKSGDIVCTWSSGTWEGATNVGILFALLPFEGKQWDAPQSVAQRVGVSYQNPVPFEAPDGRIWVFHTSQEASQTQADAQVFVTLSTDQGGSWGYPSLIFDTPGSFVRQPLLILPDGRWLLPMSMTPTEGITKGAEAHYPLLKVSPDAGHSWSDIKFPQSNGLVEPSVLRLTNGKFLAFFRSRYADFIYESTSDDGTVWTAPHPTALPNNNSSIQAMQLENGHLVIAFNNTGSAEGSKVPKIGPRRPLSVALSDDQGAHWRWVRDLEPGHPGEAGQADWSATDKPGAEEYSYPSLLQGWDAKIYVAYTYRRYTIKVVRFAEAWIKQGGSIGTYHGEN
jgi:predicted neuraminidase